MTAWIVRAIGILLMLTALALVLSRAPDRPVETLVARWAPPPSDFISVKGQLVHVRDEGPRADPLPLVLLHGMQSSLHTWEGWVRVLKTQRRVITMDLPGFGLTGPNAGADYRSETDARFVLDVLDALQVRRFVVGGSSLGGEAAWRLALLAPERVDRLVLVAPSGLPYESPAMPFLLRLADLPASAWLLESVLPRALVARNVAAPYGHPERVTAELVDRTFELTLRQGNRRALVQRLRLLDNGADAARIAALRVPTLLLWGGRDHNVPLTVGRQFHAAIPNSQLVVFDDLGHVPHEEDPVRSAVAVKAFLGLR